MTKYRLAGEVLADQIDAILVVVFLWFSPSSGAILQHSRQSIDWRYLAVRKRFYQWILDTCNRSYDQTWLNKENWFVPMLRKSNRPCCLCTYWTTWLPLSTRSQPPLSISQWNKGHSAEDVENMYQPGSNNHFTSDNVAHTQRCIFLIWNYSWVCWCFLVFSLSNIKCCRADDGITLLAALLVLASTPTFDEFIINVLSQRCSLLSTEVIYHW